MTLNYYLVVEFSPVKNHQFPIVLELLFNVIEGCSVFALGTHYTPFILNKGFFVVEGFFRLFGKFPPIYSF